MHGVLSFRPLPFILIVFAVLTQAF